MDHLSGPRPYFLPTGRTRFSRARARRSTPIVARNTLGSDGEFLNDASADCCSEPSGLNSACLPLGALWTRLRVLFAAKSPLDLTAAPDLKTTMQRKNAALSASTRMRALRTPVRGLQDLANCPGAVVVAQLVAPAASCRHCDRLRRRSSGAGAALRSRYSCAQRWRGRYRRASSGGGGCGSAAGRTRCGSKLCVSLHVTAGPINCR